MCVSSAKADFSGTKGYVGEAKTKAYGLIHVMGYQNKVQNLSDSPNSMILHFPAKELMNKDNVIDIGSSGQNILNYMCDRFSEIPKSRGLFKGIVSNSAKVEIFDSGIYTIVMSNKPTMIPQALNSVSENKRPNISNELMEWYEKTYPGYQVAVCCFNNKESVNSTPLFWWYKPINDKELFFPAIDCHSGGIPNLKEKILVDHILSTSTLEMENTPLTEDLKYDEMISESIQEFFPKKIIGKDYRQSTPMNNGDFVIQKSDVKSGNPNFQRVTPN